MPDHSQLQLDFGMEYPPKEKLLEYIIGAFKKYNIPFSIDYVFPEIEVTQLCDTEQSYRHGIGAYELTADFGGINNVIEIQRD